MEKKNNMEKKNDIESGIISIKKILQQQLEDESNNYVYVICSKDMNKVMTIDDQSVFAVSDLTISTKPFQTECPSWFDEDMTDLSNRTGIILIPITLKAYLQHYLDRLNEALQAYETIKKIIGDGN